MGMNKYFFIILASSILALSCEKHNTGDWKEVPLEKDEHSYELVQLGSLRSDQFLVDKKTGRIWKNVCAYSSSKDTSDCDYSYWREEDIVGINGMTYNKVSEYVETIKSGKNK